MIKLENIETFNWEGAFRGLRNPMNSWKKSDSAFKYESKKYHKNMFVIGDEDMKLAKRMVKAGSDERKFLRQIFVSMDITAPLYWWKEADTYKVGTVRNSCSTMHKIAAKEFTLDDFSCEHLTPLAKSTLETVIDMLNNYRADFTLTKAKEDWWQMIQLLPSSYNQRATLTMNYENLLNIYHARKNHKLDEWKEFCKEIEKLPYFTEMCLEIED